VASVQTLCLEIQLITTLNLSLDAELFINIRSSLLIWLSFCFCLCKNYVNADAHCAGVDIGGRKWALRARVNWQCWRRQFSTIFL